jgi:hypothetical protein
METPSNYSYLQYHNKRGILVLGSEPATYMTRVDEEEQRVPALPRIATRLEANFADELPLTAPCGNVAPSSRGAHKDAY